MSLNVRYHNMTNTAIIMLWILALIVISPNILVYAQNVSGQTTQVGQTSNKYLMLQPTRTLTCQGGN